MQEKPSKACFRTTRGLDAADAVHSCFFSEGVFRGALYSYKNKSPRGMTSEAQVHVPTPFFTHLILNVDETPSDTHARSASPTELTAALHFLRLCAHTDRTLSENPQKSYSDCYAFILKLLKLNWYNSSISQRILYTKLRLLSRTKHEFQIWTNCKHFFFPLTLPLKKLYTCFSTLQDRVLILRRRCY